MRNPSWLSAMLSAVLAAILFVGVAQAQSGPNVGSGGVLNAASLASDPTNVAAPGSIITIFGQGLGNTTASAGSFPLPTVIGNSAVLLGDSFIPLLFVSPNQINAQVPFETPTNGPTPMTVWVGGQPSETVFVTVRPTAPGVFTANSSGGGAALVFNSANRLVNSTNPAQVGQEIQVLTTGLGATISAGGAALVTGGPGGDQPTLFVPTASIGGTAAAVVSARAVSGQVGQYMVRMIVPDVPVGDHVVSITSDGRSSRAPHNGSRRPLRDQQPHQSVDLYWANFEWRQPGFVSGQDRRAGQHYFHLWKQSGFGICRGRSRSASPAASGYLGNHWKYTGSLAVSIERAN